MGVLELITKFLLDPKGYEEGAKVVETVTKRVTGTIDGLRNGIVGGLQTALRVAFNPIAALAGGAGLLALGHDAVTAAIGFDTISRSLEAVTQKADRAKRILQFDDMLAGPSIFTSEELAKASLTLEAFKLTTEAYLPIAEKLGTVFGGNAEALMEFVDALGYLKNGRFGEGFESLSRAGFSRDDFIAKGLTFDKGGSYTGDADAALKAVKELTEERYGGLSKAMADGPAAKLASVMDALGRAMRVAGYAILSVAVPAAEKLGNAIAWLVDGGYIEKAIDGIAKLFNGADIGDALVSAVFWFVATLNHVPEIVGYIGAAFHTLLTWLRDNLLAIGRTFAMIWTFEVVFEGLTKIYSAFKMIQAAQKDMAIGAAIWQAIVTDGASLLIAAGVALAAASVTAGLFDKYAPGISLTPSFDLGGNVFGAIKSDHDSMISAYGADQKKGPTGTANSIADAVIGALSPTKQIAENTRRTAKATEKMASVNDQILGGGVVGKGAASAVNLDKALRGSSSSGGGDKLDQAVRLIRQHVVDTLGTGFVEVGVRTRSGGR